MARALEYKGAGNAVAISGVTGIANASGTKIMSFTQGAAVADAATQTLTGSDTVDITKLTADLTSLKTAVNAVIARLEAHGLIAS